MREAEEQRQLKGHHPEESCCDQCERCEGYTERHRQGLELEKAFDILNTAAYHGRTVNSVEYEQVEEILSRYRQQVYGKKE